MTIKATPITLVLTAAALVGVAAYFLTIPSPVEAVGGQSTVISSATTSAAVSVTTSTRVLATTTNTLGNGTSYTRVYATVCNPSNNAVYLNLDAGKNAAQAGGAFTAIIGATSTLPICYEVTDYNQYSGAITASSTNETATTVYVKDYVTP